MKWRAIAFLPLAVFAACSPKENEIPGTYIAEDDDEREVLQVKADHTYVNALYRGGKLQWQEQNRWTIDNVDGQRYVTFDNFRFGVRFSGGQYSWVLARAG